MLLKEGGKPCFSHKMVPLITEEKELAGGFVMFQIFMFVGWIALLVILLYVWADVRELTGAVKEIRREMMRSSLSGRTSGNRQQTWEQDTEQDGAMELSNRDEKQREEYAVRQEKMRKDDAKQPSDEQILQEVLAEFLG